MEKSIEEIDKNFKLTTSCGKEVKWYDGFVYAALAIVAIMTSMSVSTFLYFNF